jgi:hypothetical protein
MLIWTTNRRLQNPRDIVNTESRPWLWTGHEDESQSSAAPPEYVGGPWGDGDYLAVIAAPKYEQYLEMMEWRGQFYPEAFDVKVATKEKRKVTP